MLQAINLGTGIQSVTLAQMNAATGVDGVIVYNSTYKQHFRFVVDRWLPFGWIDPRIGGMHIEEWDGATVAAGFPVGNNTTGTGNTLNGSPANTSLGELVLECTAASQTANWRTSLTQSLLGGADYYIEYGLRVPTLATVGEDFSIGWGWQDNAAYDAATLCTDGVWGTLNRGINTTKIIMNTSSNSSRTATNSSVTDISAGVNFRAGIYLNAATSAAFTINGVSQGAAVATNLPTGAGRFTGLQLKLDKHAGTSASQVVIDWFMIYYFFTAQRFS